jgi:hypothetical protein
MFKKYASVYYLYDMLIEFVELGLPLRTLDLRTCTTDDRVVQLLSEIVVDIQGPVKERSGYLDWRRPGGAGVLGEEGGIIVVLSNITITARMMMTRSTPRMSRHASTNS